jgi:hypothetical protein
MGIVTLFLSNIHANRTLEIVYELRDMGLVTGVDFEFKFINRTQSWILDDEEEPWGAEFTFKEDKWATWFTLKYL